MVAARRRAAPREIGPATTLAAAPAAPPATGAAVRRGRAGGAPSGASVLAHHFGEEAEEEEELEEVPRFKEDLDEDEEDQEQGEQDEDSGSRQRKRPRTAVKAASSASLASGAVTLSLRDRDPRAELSADLLSVSGNKGFRSARATHGVSEGRWFCEMEIVEQGIACGQGASEAEKRTAAGHVRVGWSTAQARVDGPVGMCKHGFAFRDVDGSKVHDGWRSAYSTPAVKGDVIGMLIDLGKERAPAPGVGAGAQPEHPACAAPTPPEHSKPIPGSFVQFFKNGRDQGVAFEQLEHPGLRGYLATASVYQHATARFNPGPTFRFPPPRARSWSPLSQMSPAAASQQPKS
jgi:hypothetical protein